MQRLLPTPHGEQERVAVAQGAARRSLPTPHGEQELRRRPRCILVAHPSNPSWGTRTTHEHREYLRVRVLPTPHGEQEHSPFNNLHRFWFVHKAISHLRRPSPYFASQGFPQQCLPKSIASTTTASRVCFSSDVLLGRPDTLLPLLYSAISTLCR